MRVPVVKSRNFSSIDIARTAVEVDATGMLLTGYAWGYIQCLRDGASKHFGPRFKGLKVSSSNRASYNANVPNAADDSHHIWRVEPNGQLHVALDVVPLGVTLDEFYDFAITHARGEIYLNRKEGIVHVAPVPMEDEHWKQ